MERVEDIREIHQQIRNQELASTTRTKEVQMTHLKLKRLFVVDYLRSPP